VTPNPSVTMAIRSGLSNELIQNNSTRYRHFTRSTFTMAEDATIRRKDHRSIHSTKDPA
jgi:hypothetical protein